jgi:F-type H+-transporting ATPase subunit b
MLIILLVFIGLIVYLNKALYQPLITFMDQRDATIAKDRKEAEELTSYASTLKQEAEEILNSAKQEAMKLKQQVLEEINSEASKLIESKEAELEKAYQEFLKELEIEKEEVKNSILSQVPLIKESLKAKFSQL